MTAGANWKRYLRPSHVFTRDRVDSRPSGVIRPARVSTVGLETYRKKRKFDVTPEPRGRAARSKGHSFVVQKHAARRLHYDFRLELDGVMKSWAVTKGPSLDPGEKRLAVQVEDHPIEYNDFEGTIPEGQYGGGTVMIWDRGAWSPEGDPHKGYRRATCRSARRARSCIGGWHLVRMRKRPGEKQGALAADQGATTTRRGAAPRPTSSTRMPRSVVTGRSIPEIAEGKGRKRVWNSNRSAQDNVQGRRHRSRHDAAAETACRASGANGKPASARKSRARTKTRKTKTRGKAAKKRDPAGRRRCPTSYRRRLPRCATVAPDGPAGCTRSSSTATASRRGSIMARCVVHPQGARLDGQVSECRRRDRELPADDRADRRRDRRRGRTGVPSFSALQAALKDGSADAFVYYAFDLLLSRRPRSRPLPLCERKAELTDLVAA